MPQSLPLSFVLSGVRRVFLPLALLGLASFPARAETSLARTFASAWQRQPAAAALLSRTQAAAARQQAAAAWSAGPPSLELGARSDRFDRHRGALEQEVGLTVPLWLPGERMASQSLAAAEAETVHRQAAVLRWQLAQRLRENWWAWQIAQHEMTLAETRVLAAARLRDDVAHRFHAGDLSRADLNSAAGALAQAEVQAAELAVQAAQAAFRLRSLTGSLPEAITEAVEAEPLPQVSPALNDHPEWRALSARLQRAEADLELARQQTRANPEVAISTRRERAVSDEALASTWALALRIPFGAGARQDARIASARADALELHAEAERLRERLGYENELAVAQLASARRQLASAENRASLARENRGFYDKSFRLGESDLPTRLRIEAEAFEAERALGRARIALAQGISQWRQSLGLLPE